MLNRFQIKELRDLTEKDGMFCEAVLDDCIVVSSLIEEVSDVRYRVYYDTKCPKCDSLLYFPEVDYGVIFMCLKVDCVFVTKSK